VDAKEVVEAVVEVVVVVVVVVVLDRSISEMNQSFLAHFYILRFFEIISEVFLSIVIYTVKVIATYCFNVYSK
jgi:hypothetical protein